MGGCQGKSKKKNRNSLQTSDSRASNYRPVITLQQIKQKSNTEIKATGNQRGIDDELQKASSVPLAKEEDLEIPDTNVIQKVQKSQKQGQYQNDKIHFTDIKDVPIDSFERNVEVKKEISQEQDEIQENIKLNHDKLQEDGVSTDIVHNTKLKEIFITDSNNTDSKDDHITNSNNTDSKDDHITNSNNTDPKVTHITNNNKEDANFGYGANFAKGAKAQSFSPLSLDGQSMQSPSLNGQPNTEIQRLNNSVERNQQGASNGSSVPPGNATSGTADIPRNVSEKLHIQQPESATYQNPETSNSRGSSSNTNSNSSNLEPCPTPSNQNLQSPESKSTTQRPNDVCHVPGSDGTQPVADLHDNAETAEFAQPIEFEDDVYNQIIGLAIEEHDKFEGFKSKKTKPTVKFGSQNQSRRQIERKTDDDDDSDDDDTDSDSTDSDETDSDDTDSDESSSDEEPQRKLKKSKTKNPRIQINKISGAKFAAIGNNAKFIDMRVMKPEKKTEKKNAKPKPSNTNREDNKNTNCQENTIKTDSESTDLRPQKNTHVSSRPNINDRDRIQDLKAVVEASKSVGIIFGPNNFSATVFRVGDEYVMTDWHVVHHLITEGHGTMPYHNEMRFNSEEIFIDFQYHQHKRPASDHLKFSVTSVEYHSPELDIAVLKLKKKENEAFPPPLTYFKEIDPKHYGKPIYFVGHTGGEPKEDDRKITIWNPYPWRMNKLRDWSQKTFHTDGYSGMDDPQKLIFDCSFRHGASGSPGISHGIDHDHKDIPVVVTVLLRGFPDFYYFTDFTESDKARVPPEMLKQQGVRIGAVMNHMKQIHSLLYENIFCRHQQPQQNLSLGGTVPHSPISSPVTEGPSCLIPSTTQGLEEDVVQ